MMKTSCLNLWEVISPSRKYAPSMALIVRQISAVCCGEDLRQKEIPSIYRSVYVLTFTYAQRLLKEWDLGYKWPEWAFFYRVAGHSLLHRVKSSVIQEDLGVEPLPLQIEKSAEMAPTSVLYSPWTPSMGAVLWGISHREEAYTAKTI